MLDILQFMELVLPVLLDDPSGWESLYADSERPVLRRLWRQFGEYRIYLHRFDPCGAAEAFLHPHPWKFAVRVVRGAYEMSVSTGNDPSRPPAEASAKILMQPGSAYEMTCSRAFHAIRPSGAETVYSVMVAGDVCFPENRVIGNAPSRPLTEAERMDIIVTLRAHYPHPTGAESA